MPIVLTLLHLITALWWTWCFFFITCAHTCHNVKRLWAKSQNLFTQSIRETLNSYAGLASVSRENRVSSCNFNSGCWEGPLQVQRKVKLDHLSHCRQSDAVSPGRKPSPPVALMFRVLCSYTAALQFALLKDTQEHTQKTALQQSN